MCDRLTGKSRMEISKCHIYDQCTDKDRNETKQKLELAKQNCITDSADHAETGSLCQDTNDHTCCQ